MRPGPAEDERDKKRGGAANVERAVRRQRMSRLYADRTYPAAQKSKTASPEVSRAKKSKTVSPENSRGTRPEDKYGVRRRIGARNKVQRASRSRDRAGLVA